MKYKLKIEKTKIKKCNNLQDVRNNIDELDEQIIPLLCQRIQYIVQAAQFKDTIADTRRFGRIEAIVTRAKSYAKINNVSQDYIESVYRGIIDESIRQEKEKWLKINGDKNEDQ